MEGCIVRCLFISFLCFINTKIYIDIVMLQINYIDILKYKH